MHHVSEDKGRAQISHGSVYGRLAHYSIIQNRRRDPVPHIHRCTEERFGVQLCPVQLSRNQEMCREGPKCNQQRHPVHPVPSPAWC